MLTLQWELMSKRQPGGLCVPARQEGNVPAALKHPWDVGKGENRFPAHRDRLTHWSKVRGWASYLNPYPSQR